jgi:prephenate dehydrogenase
MTINLSIIGLGQIGSSIGLALADHPDKFIVTGSDIDKTAMHEAQRLGAVAKTSANLSQTVRKADVVIMALPLDQMDEMVKAVAPILDEGTILIETTPTKKEIVKLMEKHLPENCSYVGLTPVLNPLYLFTEENGVAAAKADLFHDGLFCIITPSQSNTTAIDFTLDLIQHLGANPLFIGLEENDGLLAATHYLPQLLSIVLLNATVDLPGWEEARKVAGRAFAEVAGPTAHLDNAEAIKSGLIYNQENILRKIDDMINILNEFRQEISNKDEEALTKRISHAKKGINKWWQDRGRGNWIATENPQAGSLPYRSNLWGNLFGVGFGSRKRKDNEP